MIHIRCDQISEVATAIGAAHKLNDRAGGIQRIKGKTHKLYPFRVDSKISGRCRSQFHTDVMAENKEISVSGSRRIYIKFGAFFSVSHAPNRLTVQRFIHLAALLFIVHAMLSKKAAKLVIGEAKIVGRFTLMPLTRF